MRGDNVIESAEFEMPFYRKYNDEKAETKEFKSDEMVGGYFGFDQSLSRSFFSVEK